MMRRPILLFLAAAVALAACGSGDDAADGPNVVILVMDTARADRCSVNGYDRPTTPRLAELAAEATVFADAWSPSPWTAPAHASLFTGLRPEHHGFRRGNAFYLADDRVTLAERLRDAGWRTGAFSQNAFVSREFGLAQGFQHESALYRIMDPPYPTAPHGHDQALDWALAKPGPFFLFVNDMEPHTPYTPPEEYERRFCRPGVTDAEVAAARDLDPRALFAHNLGTEFLDDRTISILSDLYDAEIACLDQAIGDFVARLRAAGVLDDTILVITSDHGENLGEHGLVEHQFSCHRTLLHIPLLIRFPPRFRPGAVVSDTVRFEDLAPTILELCGLPPEPGIDGSSILSDLPGRMARAILGDQSALIGSSPAPAGAASPDPRRRASIRSVYDGRHHLIVYSDGREELYDVREDPREENVLSRAAPEIVRRLRTHLPVPP